MRWLAGILLLILLGLQYRLWVGDGGLAEVQAMRDEIGSQKKELDQLRARNQTLEAEVSDLRKGLDALEERARSELGMIKKGEIFLQVIEERKEEAFKESSPSAGNSSPMEQGGGSRSATGKGGGLARQGVAAGAGRN